MLISTTSPLSSISNNTSTLSFEQINHFYLHGFLILKHAASQELIQAALDALPQPIANTVSYDPAVLNLLYSTNIHGAVQQLIGADKQLYFDQGPYAQVAVREPGYGCIVKNSNELASNNSDHWHIDGTFQSGACPTPGHIRNFTLLIGVFLTSVQSNNAGNLAIYPGSHRALEQFFKQSSNDHIEQLKQVGGQYLIANKVASTFPLPLMQIKADAGDCILMHYSVAHTIAANETKQTRTTLYFRIKARNIEWYNGECLDDIWHEYKGVKDAMNKSQGAIE